MAPRETEDNAYAKFRDDKQRALWYVMVFSGVVNLDLLLVLRYPQNPDFHFAKLKEFYRRLLADVHRSRTPWLKVPIIRN